MAEKKKYYVDFRGWICFSAEDEDDANEKFWRLWDAFRAVAEVDGEIEIEGVERNPAYD
jgi:hypothetical protein